jgi:endonuclease/exonuclease/phosphatase (EEP) superfamily protein YafD
MRGGIPIILAGNLNATPDSEPLARLRENWLIAGDGEMLPTIPVAVPARQIDYILCRPPERWRIAEALVLEDAEASDHRPIAAALELRRV